MLAKPVLGMSLAALLAAGLVSPSLAAGPEVVSGPGVNPSCFAPFSADTKYLKFPKKEPPYRIAMANGFVGNTWRIQMIKTLKAYAEQPDVAPMIEDSTVLAVDGEYCHKTGALMYSSATETTMPRIPPSTAPSRFCTACSFSHCRRHPSHRGNRRVMPACG